MRGLHRDWHFWWEFFALSLFFHGRHERRKRAKMCSFKEARGMLLVSHDMNVISAKENTSRNPEFSYGLYQRFDLNEILEPECKAEMRFNKNDIPVLAEALELPERFACSQRTIVDKLEGLCLLLRQPGYICHYSDLTPRPGRPVPELSIITNCVIDHLYNSHGHRITRWNHQILKPRFFRRMLIPSLNKVPCLIIALGLLTEL